MSDELHSAEMMRISAEIVGEILCQSGNMFNEVEGQRGSRKENWRGVNPGCMRRMGVAIWVGVDGKASRMWRWLNHCVTQMKKWRNRCSDPTCEPFRSNESKAQTSRGPTTCEPTCESAQPSPGMSHASRDDTRGPNRSSCDFDRGDDRGHQGRNQSRDGRRGRRGFKSGDDSYMRHSPQGSNDPEGDQGDYQRGNRRGASQPNSGYGRRGYRRGRPRGSVRKERPD
jgi:hypothetical protein